MKIGKLLSSIQRYKLSISFRKHNELIPLEGRASDSKYRQEY